MTDDELFFNFRNDADHGAVSRQNFVGIERRAGEIEHIIRKHHLIVRFLIAELRAVNVSDIVGISVQSNHFLFRVGLNLFRCCLSGKVMVKLHDIAAAVLDRVCKQRLTGAVIASPDRLGETGDSVFLLYGFQSSSPRW